MAGCVDASLVVRILDAHSAALAAWERLVRLGGDLIAPNLLHYEVANVLHQQRRAKKISAETAQDGLRRVMNLPIELYSDTRLHSRALEIARDRHLSATYDAHYVALAERFRVPLWTCDRRLADALGDGVPEVHLVP
ncbi:MAG: type II toxin-antitoxin system VapC family toxin [Pseudonocardiaceae bacterium]